MSAHACSGTAAFFKVKAELDTNKSAKVGFFRRRAAFLWPAARFAADADNLAPMACAWRDASVLVQVDRNAIDMFCNWLVGYRKLGLTNPVYAVAHGDAAARLESYLDVTVLRPPRMRWTSNASGAGAVGNFASASFYALNTAKIRAARDLLASTGRPILFTDVDTLWLRSPLAALSELPRTKHFALAPEANDKLPGTNYSRPLVCACFFAACPTVREPRPIYLYNRPHATLLAPAYMHAHVHATPTY